MKRTITILLGFLLLTMSTAYAASYSLGTLAVLVGPAAGSNSVTLAVTPETGGWTASTNAVWLHVPDSFQNGVGSTNVVFGFDANPGGPRSGTLTIAGQTLTVTQAGSTYVAAGTTTLVSGIPFADGITVDNEGNVYIAIANQNEIAKWTATNNTVTAVVSSAGLNYPVGVAVDTAGDIFIADQDSGSIKLKIFGIANIITIVSGLSGPRSIALDTAQNLYFADGGTIKERTPSNTLATLVSMGTQGLAVDGAGKSVYFGSDGLLERWTAANSTLTELASSSFSWQQGVAVDGEGNVYIAAHDPYYSQNAIQKWTAANNILTTLVSSGSAQYFGLAVDGAGNLYFTDAYNGLLQELPNAFVDPTSKSESLAAGQDSLPAVLPSTVNLLAPFAPSSDSSWLTITGVTNGVVSYSFTKNLSPTRTGHIKLLGQTIAVTQIGPTFSLGASALVEGPSAGSDSVVLAVTPNIGVWTATTNVPWLHLSPANQSGIGSTNVVFTFDANPGATRSGALIINGQTLTITQAGSSYIHAQPLTPLLSLGLNQPGGLAVDGAGNIYIADTDHNAIKQWMVTNNSVTTLVSSGLNRPQAVAVDHAGNVYIADTENDAIKEWTAANGNVTTLVSSGLNRPQGVAVDGTGNIYIADTFNSAVKEWNAANSNVVTLVGSGLNFPVGVAVDGAGNVYIADTGNNALKEWNAVNNTVTALISVGPSYLSGVAVDGRGNIYIADADNSVVEKWTVASNTLSMLVPSGLASPSGVAVDGKGNVYIADTGNNAIKELPYAFVDTTARLEGPNAGSDALPGVLPSTENLLAPFNPTSDQLWLTNTSIINGMVHFSFSANTGLTRTAHISLFGQDISITQAAAYVASPVFSPPSGTGLTNGSLISISCVTPGAVIYFTTNSSPASTNSAVYTSPITFNGPGPFTVNAIAAANQYTGTSSASATYSFPQVAAPLFTPPSGPITNGTTIAISCATQGALIYYTLDGSTPSTNSPQYSGPFVINGGVTVSAYAVAAGHIDSTVTRVTYSQAQIGMPQFAPSQGPVTNGTLISITSTNANAVIYYTLDGSTPTTNSPIYTGPILFTNQFTLQAQVFANGYLPSGVNSVFYGLLDVVTNVAVTTFAGSPSAGLLDGVGVAAKFSHPEGICIDTNGNLFVSDTGNNCIRRILPSGQVITYAGNGSITNSQSPSATNAFFNAPAGVCLDTAGSLYVADSGNNNRICKIGTDGSFAVYAYVRPGYAAGFGQLIADPAGNLYAGNWAEAYEILTNGSVEALAGTSCNCPGGWGVSVGLGLDAATNLYAATGNDIWMIPPGGPVSFLAGGASQVSDGIALQAGFAGLTAAVVDTAGNMYLSDLVRIRKLSPSGWVSTVAGTGVAGYGDGPGTAAQFNGAYPWYLSAVSHMGLCLDAAGNLYVSDTANNCIRKVSFNTVARPRLQVSYSTNLVSVAWPSWASDFVLESSGTLSAGGSWMPVTSGATVLQGGTNYVWTNQFGNGASFYRLHRP